MNWLQLLLSVLTDDYLMDLTAEHLKAPKAISISFPIFCLLRTQMSTWGHGVETFKQAHRAQKGAAALGAVLCGLRACPAPAKTAQQKTGFKSSSESPARSLLCSQLIPPPPTSSVRVSLPIIPLWRQEPCLNSSDSLLSMSLIQKCLLNKTVRKKTRLIFFLDYCICSTGTYFNAYYVLYHA